MRVLHNAVQFVCLVLRDAKECASNGLIELGFLREGLYCRRLIAVGPSERCYRGGGSRLVTLVWLLDATDR